MKRLMLLISIVLAMNCSSSALMAYTLTFDDIPPGQDLSYYYEQYGFGTALGWEVVDHSESNWGLPHSGTQVLMWNGNPVYGSGFWFGIDGVSEYSVRSVGAYFSTEPGIVLQMIGRSVTGTVASAIIGAPGESWDNRYVEIFSEAGDIGSVHIIGVNSQDERYHFCMDDLKVEPVPEPSSFLALTFGLLPVGVAAMRRWRK